MQHLSALLFSSLLIFLAAVDYQFTGLAVYGLDRSISNGIGPSNHFLNIQSPFRQSIDDEADLAAAGIKITRRGELIVRNRKGGIVALMRKNDMIYPPNFKNKNSQLNSKARDDYIIDDARSGDIVVLYVPHSTRLPISKTQFYKAFNGREHNPVALVNHFVERYVTDEAVSRRFTLVVARIQRFQDAIQRRFTLVNGPAALNASDDGVTEPILSFTGPQPIRQTPSNIPSNMVSPGLTLQPAHGQTQVYSNQRAPQNQFQTQQPQQPLSFNIPRSNSGRGKR